MMASSLSRMAAAVRVLFALCIFLVSLDVVVAEDLPFTVPSDVNIGQETDYIITWPYESSGMLMALCQTNASDATGLRDDNTWLVLQVDFNYLHINEHKGGDEVTVSITLQVPPQPPQEGSDYKNFFFCWGNAGTGFIISCQHYSNSFDVINGQRTYARSPRRVESVPGKAQPQPRALAGTPTTPLAITTSIAVLSIPGSPTPTVSASTLPPLTGSPVVVTMNTATQTITPSATPSSGTDAGATSKSSSSKLGIGPIVGIAIGGVVFLVLLVLLAIFCIRRRRNGNDAKHTLLRSGSIGSHDVMQGLQTEKASHASTIPSVPMLALHENPASTASLDHLDQSEPYSGPAAPRSRAPSTSPQPTTSTFVPATPPPPTAPAAAAAAVAAPAALAPALTVTLASPIPPDNVSEISATMSPRSTVRSMSTYSAPYGSPYTDTPTYGDARHTPQFYEASSQNPFLSEPGMSPEELSRLEEEERRIDAAIAEAEAARR